MPEALPHRHATVFPTFLPSNGIPLNNDPTYAGGDCNTTNRRHIFLPVVLIGNDLNALAILLVHCAMRRESHESKERNFHDRGRAGLAEKVGSGRATSGEQPGNA